MIRDASGLPVSREAARFGFAVRSVRSSASRKPNCVSLRIQKQGLRADVLWPSFGAWWSFSREDGLSTLQET
jgi:hypothetical protein